MKTSFSFGSALAFRYLCNIMDETSYSGKRIARNSLMLYLRMFVTMVIAFYTSRELLRVLGVEDYGTYNVVGSFVAVFSLFNSGVTLAIQRFLNYEIGTRNSERLQRVFSTSFNILFGISLLIVLLGESAGWWFVTTQLNIPAGREEVALWVYQLTLLIFLINIVGSPFQAAIIAHEHFKAYAMLGMFEELCKLSAVFLLMVIPFDKLILYMLLLTGVAVITRGAYMLYCRKRFAECRYRFCFDRGLMREMFSFSAWNIFGSCAYIAKVQGVNIIINIFYGVTVNAAQGIANQVNQAVTAFITSFTTAVNPQIIKLYAQKDYGHLYPLVFKGSRIAGFLVLLFVVPIVCETQGILGVWLYKVEIPRYTVVFTQLILINALIDSFSQSLITLINAVGRIARYQMVVGGILILNLPFTLLALWLGAPPYAAMIVGCGLSVAGLIARITIISRQIDFPWREYLIKVLLRAGIVIACVGATIAAYKMVVPHYRFDFLVNIAVCLLVTATCIYTIGLDATERHTVREKITTWIKKPKSHDKNRR